VCPNIPIRRAVETILNVPLATASDVEREARNGTNWRVSTTRHYESHGVAFIEQAMVVRFG
jgi:hypothetical protein